MIIQIAEHLIKHNDLWGSIILYNVALKIKPNHINLIEQLQVLLNRKNALEKTIQLCRHAVEMNPNSEQAYYDLGMA